jgi:hypothetical protein
MATSNHLEGEATPPSTDGLAPTVRPALGAEQRAVFERDGFVKLTRFATPDVGDAMLARVVELARRAALGDDIAPAFVLPEQQDELAARNGAQVRPEDLVSKVFRLARDTAFHEFAVSPAVTDLVVDLLDATEVDVFLSQFIFKNPGAWGQPWHQDSYYFPFEPARPVLGVWLAISEANLRNGCLHVLPGSHREPIATHVDDRRPNANYGYVEIVDHEMSASVPVLMDPGDLLLFDSHLMHRSTDNESDGLRAAMVYHYCAHGTVERTPGLVNDFVAVR